jgi:hypothetical protein
MKPYPNFRDAESRAGMTWNDLTALEPRLAELLWAARQGCVACGRWLDVDRVFAPIRARLTELVGFAGEHHRHPVLGSSWAYQIAYWKLYDAVAGSLPSRAGCAKETLTIQPSESSAEITFAEPAAWAFTSA